MITFFQQFFGDNRQSNQQRNRQKKASAPHSRRLQVEPLESREMLSISPADYDSIRATYPDLNLSANMGDYNVIEITSDQLADANLREAIETAGTTAENDLIVLRTTDSHNTITLSGMELGIDINASQYGSVTIVSFGTGSLTLDANEESRVLNITNSTVALAGLTITGGKTTGNGGGIYNSGILTATDCTISGNSVYNGIPSGGGIHNSGMLILSSCTISDNSTADAGFGSGIYNDGEMTIINGTISGNTAAAQGGGIYNGGLLTITNSSITENSSHSISHGGGIYNNLNGSVTITSSTISGNSVIGTSNYSYGGGICNTGLMSVTNSTITKNWAAGAAYSNGGGIYNNTTLTVTDCVISENSADWGGGSLYNDLDGEMTITGSMIFASTASSYGGGIYTVDRAALTLTNCIISDNSTDYYGGGIYYNSSGTMTVTNSTISGNSASSYGGGIYGSGTGTMTVTNSTIAENLAASSGGGIYSTSSSTVIVEDSIITENSATSNGGGIYSGGTSTMTNCTVSGNFATYGGGIDNRGTLTITNSTIADNSASYSGGGIYNDGTLTVSNSTVTGNTTSSYGGGIRNYGTLAVESSTITNNTASSGGGVRNSGTLMVANCMITNNIASGNGGGINNYDGSSELTITNSTVAGNTASGNGGGICIDNGVTNLYNTIVAKNSSDIYRYSGMVYGYNSLTSFSAWSGTSENNLVYNPDLPLFVDFEGRNYRLALDSQAVDQGDNQHAYNASLDENSKDMFGNPRFVGESIDIGACELGFIISQSVVFRGSVSIKWPKNENVTSTKITWVSGTTTRILGNFEAEGSLLWDTSTVSDGSGILKVEWFDSAGRLVDWQNLSATIINDASVVIHRGEITSNETWNADKIHLVVGRLDVKSGVQLTVSENAIVKFWKSSYLNTLSGSTVSVRDNAVFTRAEDDEIGGDANKDGSNSLPMTGNAYVRGVGIINIAATVEQKYLNRTVSGSLSGNETWYSGQVYHITGTVTVPTGVTLTIMPGAILKFDKNCSLVVNSGGTLIAEGNAAQPIIFTSIKDDAYGGDTNEDEDKTHPASGDWHQIRSNGGTIVLDYTRISYCSNVNNDGGLGAWGGSITFNNSIISFTKYDAMRGSGSFMAHNSVFSESSMAVSPRGSASQQVFTNCTFVNNTVAVRGGGTFINCVFANISSIFDDSGWGTTTYLNCAFWNPKGLGPQTMLNDGQNIIGSNGNLWANPMFRDAVSGDYRLQPGSPLIDAADGTKAPATDITGTPRVSDPHITSKTGTQNAEGVYTDIGAYEFTDSANSSIDLQPVDLQSPSSVTTGEKITLQWTIHNNGSAPAIGTWTDRIVMISDAGQVVTVGEITHSGNISGGDLQTFYAELVIPNVAVGNWRFAVYVNVNRNIFEGQSIDNNEISAANITTVDVPLLTETHLEFALQRGNGKLYRVDLPAGKTFSLSAFSVSAVSILLSQNHAPTATSSDYAASNDGKGNYSMYVPAASTARTFYLAVGTDKPVANVTLAISNQTLAAKSVSQSNVSNAGASTIGFIGAGFDSTMTVALKLGSVTIPGTALSVTSGSDASARFDLTGRAAGVYDLVVTKNGRTVTLEKAVTITANGIGAKLDARLDIVDAVRVGRIYEGYIIFENTGDCDLLLPVFTIRSNTNTPLGLTSDNLAAGQELHLLAVGSSGSAGVLRPGETGKVTFYYQATNNTSVSFSTWVNDDTATPFFTSDHWTNWGDFHQDLSDAMTRLEQRGYLPKDYNELKSFVTAQKTGQDTTGLSGQLRNTQTGEAIAGARILAEWTVGEEMKYDYAKTDASGHYVFNYLPANGTVALSLSDTAYNLSATTTQMSAGKDANGFNMTALPFGSISGRVSFGNGSGMDGFIVMAENSAGEIVSAVTNSSGSFLLESLKWDTWNVAILNPGIHQSISSETVTVNSGSQISRVQFTLSATGNISGRVLDKSNQPLAEVVVRIVNVLGEWVALGVTDESGNYLIENVPVGTYRIFAINETLSWQQQEVVVKSNEATGIDLVASSSALSGKIFTPGNTPVTEGNVVIYNIGDIDDPAFQTVMLSTEIGSDGCYQFDSLLPGEYLLEVHTESGTAFVRVTIGTSSDVLNITLPTQTGFSGKVNFASPIPQDEIIYVFIVSEDESVQVLIDTDENGNFSAGKIPQGKYRVIVFSADGILAEQDVILNNTIQSVQINTPHAFPAQSPVMAMMAMQNEIVTMAAGISHTLDDLYHYFDLYYPYPNPLYDVQLPSTSSCPPSCLVREKNVDIYFRKLRLKDEWDIQYKIVRDAINWIEASNKGVNQCYAGIVFSVGALTSQSALALILSRGALAPAVAYAISAGTALSALLVQTMISPSIDDVADAYVSVAIDTLDGALDKLKIDVLNSTRNMELLSTTGWFSKLTSGISILMNIVDTVDKSKGFLTMLRGFQGYIVEAHQRADNAIAELDRITAKLQELEYLTCDEKHDESPPEDEPKDDKGSNAPQSCDPNEIAGPVGFDFDAYNAGTEDEPYLVITTPNWTSDANEQAFTIYFENKASAAAAAQEVWVATQLPEEFDWSTFTLAEVAIGNQIFNEMVSYADGTWFLQQSSTGEQIQMSVTYDTLTGMAEWYLRSYVANTIDHFPVSAYDGFLPPNDETHRGEGYVKFGIRVKDDTETGTVIETNATIIFDTNDPIITNVWKNTIDVDAPESSVLPLPGVTETNDFLVTWAGSDVGSGIAYYDVYVAIDDGDFIKWITTNDTEREYHGSTGHTYSFYSIAVDNVLHREIGVKTAEASIMVLGTFVELPTAVIDNATNLSVQEDCWMLVNSTDSLDPLGKGLTYLWDFTGNGDFREYISEVAWFSAENLDGKPNATHTIRLKVRDADGNESEIAEANVRIVDAAPTITIGSPEFVEKRFGYWELEASDSSCDSICKWVIEWGDGQKTELIGGPRNRVSLSHYYLEAKEYTAKVTVTDDDGIEFSFNHTINVTPNPQAMLESFQMVEAVTPAYSTTPDVETPQTMPVYFADNQRFVAENLLHEETEYLELMGQNSFNSGTNKATEPAFADDFDSFGDEYEWLGITESERRNGLSSLDDQVLVELLDEAFLERTTTSRPRQEVATTSKPCCKNAVSSCSR